MINTGVPLKIKALNQPLTFFFYAKVKNDFPN
jgi:hypothetical protein